MFWRILLSISISLYVWFLEGFGFDLYCIYYIIYIIYIIYNIYMYACMYMYKFITSCTSKYVVCLMRLFWEIILPSLGLIKHVHDVINLLYYEHWTDKRRYIPYISVAHKVLKSCRSKMANFVCDVHGAPSLYLKNCWQSSFIYVDV